MPLHRTTASHITALAVCLAWHCPPCGAAAAWQAASWGAEAKALEHYKSASKLYIQGQYAQVVDELKLSLQLNPTQLRPTKLLGLSYQLIGNLSEAEQAFLQATRLDPKDSEAWFFLGRAWYQENFFDRALEAIERALDLNSSDVRAREHLALTLEAMGDTERALKEYEEGLRQAAIQKKPSWTLHLTYGVLLHKLDRLDESEKQLLAARDLNPNHWQARFELGKIHYETAKPELAAGELTAALKTGTATEEEALRVYRLLGRVYYALGRDDDAQKAFAMADKSKP